MSAERQVFRLDGREIPFRAGDTIMDAALAAGVYIPHLCHNPEFTPHGSCRVCVVRVGGRHLSACTQPAAPDLEVESDSERVNAYRRTLVQMLFVEGNHVCPGCERSGACQLQAVAYHVGMLAPRFPHFFPKRTVDASHPAVIIDFNRCILCELCVRASREVDRKSVFAIGGRGIHAHLLIDSPTGRLGDSLLAADDRAVAVCPVGAILPREVGFSTPIGERPYDLEPIDKVGDAVAARRRGHDHG